MPKKGGLPRRPWLAGADSPEIDHASTSRQDVKRYSWPLSPDRDVAQSIEGPHVHTARMSLPDDALTSDVTEAVNAMQTSFRLFDQNKPGASEMEVVASPELMPIGDQSDAEPSIHCRVGLERPPDEVLHELSEDRRSVMTIESSPMCDIQIPKQDVRERDLTGTSPLSDEHSPLSGISWSAGYCPSASAKHSPSSALSLQVTPCAESRVRHTSKSPGRGRRSPLGVAIGGSPRFQCVKTTWMDEDELDGGRSEGAGQGREFRSEVSGTPDAATHDGSQSIDDR